MHPVTAEVEVARGVLCVQHQILARDRQRVLDQRPGEAQALVVAVTGAGGDHVLDPGFGGIGDADRLQRGQRCLVDRPHVIVVQRLVGAALHARTNRANVFGQRCGAQRNARRPATGATLARGGWGGDFSFSTHSGELRLGAGALSGWVVHGFEGDFGGHALARDFDLVG